MTTIIFISMPKLIFIFIVILLYLYFDFRYCTHADFREGLIVENTLFSYWLSYVCYLVEYFSVPIQYVFYNQSLSKIRMSTIPKIKV